MEVYVMSLLKLWSSGCRTSCLPERLH